MSLKLPSYTGLSRHGIYYFRYPWGYSDNGARKSLRLSLQTRCPKQATSLARRLTSYCETLIEQGALQLISHKEAHGLVKSFCEENLARMKARFDEKGYSTEDLAKLESMIEWLDQDLSGSPELAEDVVTPIERFKAAHGLSESLWGENKALILPLLRKGYRAQLQEVKNYAEHYNDFDFSSEQRKQIQSRILSKHTVQDVVEAYIKELYRANELQVKTIEEHNANLELFVEIIGADKSIDGVDGESARYVKDMLSKVPQNLRTGKQTKGLTLFEAMELEDVKRLSTNSLNKKIQSIAAMYKWAIGNKYCAENPFIGMSIKQKKSKKNRRRDLYDKPALQKMYNSITDKIYGSLWPAPDKATKSDPLGLWTVNRTDCAWVTLIGMYTGARIGEICKLGVKDIKQSDEGIWYFDIAPDETEGLEVGVKTEAGIRQVPIANQLIKLDLLQYRKLIASHYGNESKLFPKFNYNPRTGYRRQASDWFNQKFLPNLDLKDSKHDFHSLRGTFMQQLLDKGIETPLVQQLVGHEVDSVTYQNYVRGHSLELKLKAVNKFSVE